MADAPLPPVAIIGRFPPPLDGQSIATRRLATLLETERGIETFSINPGEGEIVQSRVRFRMGTAAYFARTGRRLRAWLRERASSPVLWTSISGSRLGHFRDLLTVVPAFAVGQPVLGVVHHGGFADLFDHPLTRRSARHLVRQLAGVVFLSETLAARASGVPPAKRLVVPNTIDAALIATDAELTAKRQRRQLGGPLRVLYFSNMIPSKGYLDVVRAVGLLHARGIAVQAHFVGRWDSKTGREAFERAVEAAGASGVVTHHGGVADRDAARAHYLAADVFCLPTTYPTEAQPLTVIEALASGCPAVVTPHASLPEMIDEASGAFVPPHDPHALADALARVGAPEAWPALSRGARARFDALFSPEAVRNRWRSVLEGLG